VYGVVMSVLLGSRLGSALGSCSALTSSRLVGDGLCDVGRGRLQCVVVIGVWALVLGLVGMLGVDGDVGAC
jgi:hypothetical protein